MEVQGVDPDYAKRQLYETIHQGGAFRWTMYIQVMTPQQGTEVDFDPFDVTKIWPRGEYSLSLASIVRDDEEDRKGQTERLLISRPIPYAGSRRDRAQP